VAKRKSQKEKESKKFKLPRTFEAARDLWIRLMVKFLNGKLSKEEEDIYI